MRYKVTNNDGTTEFVSNWSMKLSAADERQYERELRSLPAVKDVEAVNETWYCVLTVICDDGRVIVNTTDTKEDLYRPECRSKTMRDRDIYTDWLTKDEIGEMYPELCKKRTIRKLKDVRQ